MKNRSKAYTRHQRERVIQKKMKIVRNVFYWDDKEGIHTLVRGKFSKGKVHCSCRMCRYEQYHGIPKAKYKSKWDTMKKEIDFRVNCRYGR